jgi:Carboxypeptidase regulatory-like domain/TonB dependent receptor
MEIFPVATNGFRRVKGAWRKLLALRCSILFGMVFMMQGAIAQTVSSSLRGTVKDATGGGVVGAKVALSEPATGQVVRQATSGSSGDFEFDELKPGTYELHCDAANFKPFVAQNILLESGQTRRVDPVLSVGGTQSQVVVYADAAVIATESAEISETFDAKQNDRAPLVNIYPTPYSLLTTASGVQGGFGTFPVINGEQQTQQSQSFDGIPNDLAGQQNDNSSFFDELSAETVNAPAESAVPASINLVTKRGSNDLHGVASYKIYDSVLNASSYFPPPKTPYLQHEWNLAAGGHILTDRTFFYGEWFAQRIPLGTPVIASVPTPAWRNGVFGQTIIDPNTGQPFANNTIPQDRISPVALAFQNSYIPAPTGTFASLPPVDNYPFVFPFNSDLFKGDWPMARVDHNLTKNNSLFVRWMMRQTPYVLNNGLPSLVWTRLRRHQQWAAGDTHLFSPKLINSFRFGLSYDYVTDGQAEGGQTPPTGNAVLTATGLEGSNPSGLTGQGFPTINISGLTELANVPGGVKSDNRIITFTDSVDWQLGHHVLKFGFIVQRFKNFYGTVPDFGTLSFDGSITGNPYADFLLGLPQQSERTDPLLNRTQYVAQGGIYAQDSFQVSQRLTLNYGLRWDYYGAPSAPDHLAYNFDPVTGNVIVDPAAIQKISPLYPTSIHVVAGSVYVIPDKTDFAPRIGAAYRLSEHSVLRGGYGLYTARLDAGISAPGSFNNFAQINPQLGATGPFSITESYLNVVTPGQAPLLQFPNPYPSNTALADIPSQSVFGYPRQSSLGRIQQFNVSYERQIKDIGLRASYVGSRSSGLNYQVNADLPHPSTAPFNADERPYPQFVSTYLMRSDGGAKYDGIQFEVKRRAGNLLFDGSYNYQRSLANYLDTENPYDVLSHWANDGPTRRHYATVTASWQMPFGKSQRFLSDASPSVQRLVGDWTLTSMTYLGSGYYFSPSFSGADPSNTGTFGGLPDRIGDPSSVPGGKTVLNTFNTAAFAVPQSGHFGNALPNSLENQHLFAEHLGILKVIPLTDRVTFHFTTQVSNLFNHPEFSAPSGDISVPGGAAFTAQLGVFSSLERATPRQVTFQGAFRF